MIRARGYSQMISWWVLDILRVGGPGLLIGWCVWAVVGVTLHELAHGWAAISRGDNTPIVMGHMTGNPAVHMGIRGLLFFAIVGLPSGSMPINPSNLRGRHADAWVYFCGPLMNLVLAAACVIGAGLLIRNGGAISLSAIASGGSPLDIGVTFLILGAWLNLGTALFNLLPVPPLDGGGIVKSFHRGYRDLMESENGQLIALTLFILLFLFAGRLIWPYSAEAIFWAIRMIAGRGAPATP